jgi:O-antigen ligase
MALLIIAVRDYTLITSFVETALNDSGRNELYNEAVLLIKKYPVFGVGMGYYNDSFSSILGEHKIFNFHSTFYHVFASMGVIGLIAYVYYYAKRIKIFTLKYSRFSTFGFVSFVLFACYGMINPCEFMMMPVVMNVTLIMAITEVDARKPILHDRLLISLQNRYN